MCLHRLDASNGFSSEEIALVRSLVPHLAEGLRRAIVVAAITAPQPGARGPGVIVLDEDLSISSMNTEAEQWMADLRDPRWMDPNVGSLPTAVHVAAARAAYPGPGMDAAAPVTRVRTGSGGWLSIHASRLGGATGQQTAVVLESARPVQMASLYLDAHGLTPAQSRVAALVLQGRSTRQIVNELHISPYTVQEHLRAVFDKFGIGSRRELVAALLGPPA
jgi:DNA-binding CsgD family transcriptional regulator